MFHQSVWKRAGLVLAIGSGGFMLFAPVLPTMAQSFAVQINGDIPGNAYTPSSLNAAPGDTVTWTNNDAQANHNAVCGTSDGCPADMAPNGGRLYKQGESASFTFQYSGTYHYHCVAHKGMTGTVVVSGDVHPPSSSGSGGGGSGATPAAGAAGTASGSGAAAGGPATGTATARPGQPAKSAGGTALNPAANDTASTSEAVKQSLAGITLPKPNVIVKTAGDNRTPGWVVWSSAAGLLVCAVLFGLAWFGPPLRRGGGTR